MIGNPHEPQGSTRDVGIPGAPNPESQLHCAPRLNERVRQAHSDLVQTFQRAVDSHARSLFDACIQHLTEFDQQLRSYLGHEEAELEDYLNARLAGDAQHLLAMRQVRAKLRQLARQVHEMLLPPHPSRLNPARSAGAVVTFKTMLQTLTHCVETSELELLPHCRADPAWSALPPVAEGAGARTGGSEPVLLESWRRKAKR